MYLLQKYIALKIFIYREFFHFVRYSNFNFNILIETRKRADQMNAHC